MFQNKVPSSTEYHLPAGCTPIPGGYRDAEGDEVVVLRPARLNRMERRTVSELFSAQDEWLFPRLVDEIHRDSEVARSVVKGLVKDIDSLSRESVHRFLSTLEYVEQKGFLRIFCIAVLTSRAFANDLDVAGHAALLLEPEVPRLSEKRTWALFHRARCYPMKALPVVRQFGQPQGDSEDYAGALSVLLCKKIEGARYQNRRIFDATVEFAKRHRALENLWLPVLAEKDPRELRNWQAALEGKLAPSDRKTLAVNTFCESRSAAILVAVGFFGVFKMCGGPPILGGRSLIATSVYLALDLVSMCFKYRAKVSKTLQMYQVPPEQREQVLSKIVDEPDTKKYFPNV